MFCVRSVASQTNKQCVDLRNRPMILYNFIIIFTVTLVSFINRLRELRDALANGLFGCTALHHVALVVEGE